MRYSSRILCAVVAAGLFLPGCAGLKLWQKGRHFQTSLDASYDSEKVQKVAVYAFSEGEPIDGREVPTDAMDVIGMILMLPLNLMSGSFNFGAPQVGLHQSFFPMAVTADATLEPDPSNAGPSLELANAVRDQLVDRGYSATTITDMPHTGEIEVSSILKHAREQGYDAAFIVYYGGMSAWTEFAGTETYTRGRTTVTQTNINVYEGFLYLPNAGMFDVNTGRQMWQYTNYGLVERAHLPNLSGEPFVTVQNDALIKNGDQDYFKSAPKAAKLLFDPVHWRNSYIALPQKGDGKRRM